MVISNLFFITLFTILSTHSIAQANYSSETPQIGIMKEDFPKEPSYANPVELKD